MSRSKNWCFTLNNWTPTDLEALRKLKDHGDVRYLIFQQETSSSGTPHLQGFISLECRKRLPGLRQLVSDRAHFEMAKGSPQQNRDYCSKSETAVEGSMEEFGEIPSGQGKRTDLDEVAALVVAGKSLKEVAETHPSTYIKFHRGIATLKSTLSESRETEDVRGIWLKGAPGVGKSYMVRKKLLPEETLYVKQQNKWWDNYQGEKYVLIDDLDHGAAGLGHLMKLWTDRYKATGEIKGSSTSLSYSLLFVTSNYLPSDIWEDPVMAQAISRRFKVFTVGEHNRDTIADRIKELL